MGGRNGGRKPLPDEIKILRGTDRPDRMRDALKGLQVQDWLSVSSTRGVKVLQTRRAKEIFKAKCNQLIPLRILAETDLDQLAIYANNLDKLYSLMQDLYQEGDTITLYVLKTYLDGTTEQIPTKCIINPKWKLYFHLVDTINKIGSEFGFTPVSRQKIHVPEPPKVDPLAELRKQISNK